MPSAGMFTGIEVLKLSILHVWLDDDRPACCQCGEVATSHDGRGHTRRVGERELVTNVRCAAPPPHNATVPTFYSTKLTQLTRLHIRTH